MPPRRRADAPAGDAPRASVLVPWRPTPERAPLWTYLRGLWAERFPAWQVVEGSCSEGGPWNKAAAVAEALSRAEHDIIVMADADVWTDGVAEAVARVASGAARWAVPHSRLCRLTPGATQWTLANGRWPSGDRITDGDRVIYTYEQRPYIGYVGGGMVVLTRGLYAEAPMDPRFSGWGQEDEAWACALRMIGGKEWRGLADMWHLHHPPAQRMNRFVGSTAGRMLLQRYQRARDGVRMRALIAEHQQVSA